MPTANILKRKIGVIGATSAKFESPLKSDDRQCEMSEGTAAKTWPGRNRLDQVTKPDENSAAERGTAAGDVGIDRGGARKPAIVVPASFRLSQGNPCSAVCIGKHIPGD
jgi:hypothetical protein